MRFSRKRGRPVTKKEKNDKGTKELRKKKKLDMTTEPLDLCLKKGLIDTNEHEAGIRLRWLYTLRFGSPEISAHNIEGAGASCFRDDDDNWIHARYLEYESAIKELEKIQAKRITMNICIFNQRASFLMPYQKDISTYEIKIRRAQFVKFKDGVILLSEIFRKKHRRQIIK